MQRLHLRFIIGLILIGVSLHFFAKTMRGVLSMITPLPQQTAPVVKRPTQSSLFTLFLRQVKSTVKRTKKLHVSKFEVPSIPSLPLTPVKPRPQGPVFMYILNEEPPQPVTNPALNEQEQAVLTDRLAKKRAEHAQLAQDVFALFGAQAAREVITVLTVSEGATYKDATTCKNFKQCLKNQGRLEDQKQARLTRIFERHKGSFNYKAKSGSADWNSFYQRVNNFRRAEN